MLSTVIRGSRTRWFAALLAALALSFVDLAVAAAGDTVVLSDGWRFHRGPAPQAARSADFDDSGWRELRLPHDWAIEGPFNADADGSTAKLPWQGEGWYRRELELPAGPDDRRVYLDFDGVMAFPRVYVNGEPAGRWDYGYTSFRIDATPHVNRDGKNVVAVHVDTRRWGSRWYPGAGIYRKVTLSVTGPVHLAHRGVRITTNGDERIGARPDLANVRTTVQNHLDSNRAIRVRHAVEGPDGRTVARSSASVEVPAGGSAEHAASLEVPEPLLWDTEHPHLYTLVTSLEHDGEVLDTRETRFGFRTFAFTADDGFHLNGRRVQLKGVNLHHDLGPLGAAFNRRAAQRQLEMLKEMGVNALRTAHNPPAPEVLDLADEMGLVVWDEAFDKYAWTAGRPDLQPPLPAFSRRHIAAMIERDFNHPSIVLWSIGNEIWVQEELEGLSPARVDMMAGFVRELDTTRPVGMSCHIPSAVDGRILAALDLTGWNYSRRYARYRAQYPDRPVIYSESASALSTRGYYAPELPHRSTDYLDTRQVSSYDLTSAAWSDVADAEFRLMERDRFVAGEFVWTGFDYLGEPTPFTDQARSSYFGIIDLAGFPKDRYWLYRSHWRPDAPTVHILPHWNWAGREGRNVPVFVYTNGDAAELFLNGRSLGVRRKGEVPERPPNLALEGKATASSFAQGGAAANATDGAMDTEWRPEPGDDRAWLQIDLGESRPVAQLSVDTPLKENLYAYEIEGSPDGRQWIALVEHPTRAYPLWNGPTRIIHPVDSAKARFLRLTFDHSEQAAPVGLKEFKVYADPAENDYFDVTYDYRLRWNQVTYEPGELRAVAYRGGEVIGEATVETTGPAAGLRLSADRLEIAADGEDLAFVTVEAVDAGGRPHPLADDLVLFQVGGAGEIAAVANGNPLSFEPFVSDRRHLFYGKALLIVRPVAGEAGPITVTAHAPDLAPAEIHINSRAPGGG